ncbi:hypothetical protein J416_05638 [Gracilibacillus halophilus YIM-C55.5]|uniref:Cytoplasmic protein n=1 Tax=Gracilibacillus halophilus YIM-C55.5 TaxID=1308866 RepID=N4WB03_9BACI|nr:YqgQ family protein [Gracilibacillus halophilus]ENH97468.1 hypothetical protein J416_05638 [Gracilibacillus halophilus YIM-C55.5]
MNSYQELQKLLLRFGTVIYTGDRKADINLMEVEIRELSEANVISNDEYLQAMMIISQERKKTN